MYDYSKLLGRIKEKLGDNFEFAKRMQLSERTISLKLNNKIDFKQSDIIKACAILEIALEDIYQYFFCLQSSN